MSTTKYIVNNQSGQTINGDLNVTGNVKSNSTGVYRALLTQTGEIVGTSLSDFNYGLIVGETYTITVGQTGDDFSNIANIQSGTINQTGCVFIAIGQIPAVWSNSSELTSDGGLIVDVLENTLGYNLSWVQEPFGGAGYYIAVNDTTGPVYNSFNRDKVEIITPFKYSFNNSTPFPPFVVPGVGGFMNKDEFIFIDSIFVGGPGDPQNDLLYYTPIEIKINQDTDTTPIEVYGFNISSLPYGNVSVDLYSEDSLVATFYNDTYTVVNNITEMVAKLNSDSGTNFLGTYSVNAGVENGIILTMTTSLKNQFAPNNTLTFDVFND
jgi:hypothetical protein